MSGSDKFLMITSEFPPGPGGIGNHAYNLAKYLKINGKEIKVLTVSDYTGKAESENFDKLQNFKITRFERYGNRVKTYLERISLIKKNLREGKFTHVIFSGRFALFCCAMLSKDRYRAKLISIVHGGDINTNEVIQKGLINKALEKSDLVVPVSNFSKTFIKAKISPEKITVIPNGFDLDDMDGISLHEKDSNDGKLDLVTVGTVWPRKGHHNVFKALPKLLKEYPELKYNIVGRHADLSLVKTYFDDEAFSNIVKITGQVSDKVKIEILNKSDIFILLSETQTSGDFEGFGIAVIEANYFGLPAIGSKSSGLEDSINNGVSGMLVDPKDPDEILNAVKIISENYSEFSKNAREWALQHHWSGIVKRYITAINDIK